MPGLGEPPVGKCSTERHEANMFPQLSHFTDLGILLLRLMVALIFGTSGYSHVTKAEERAKMSKAFTIFLGFAEMAVR